ncbi:HotDog domain-containing protein [Pseudomassariella vexata]|uniref:HotDog domain-containing protein n=1 Tax=Pseudomassariella vexata TaxID=1141098 RepID=A0A1Y2DDS9_9PEZI|nr:HotDog domain-containing protein [Pseudomassariella vexata]ORY56835.1 HotDog domain-containing protein [Pseudomassariella vexata]
MTLHKNLGLPTTIELPVVSLPSTSRKALERTVASPFPTMAEPNPNTGFIAAILKLEGIERVKRHIELYAELERDADTPEWMATLLPHISVQSHSASMPQPRVTFRFTVQPTHSNGHGNMHGGCTATLFDFLTTLPLHLISKPGFWQFLGVSRTLNCTYLRPVPVGSVVDIECEILQVGKKLMTAKGIMRSVEKDGTVGPILVVCEHGKVSTDPPVSGTL